MTTDEVIAEISKAEYKGICRKLLPNYADDLYQELVLTILEKDEDKFKNFKDCNSIRYYAVGILCNMVYSKTSQFYKKIRQRLPDWQPPNDEPNDSDLSGIANELLEKQYWFDKHIFKLYINKGSIRKVANDTGINRGIVYSSIQNTREKIKRKMKPLNILLIKPPDDTGLNYHRQDMPHQRLLKTHQGEVTVTEMRGGRNASGTYEASIDSLNDETLKQFDIVYYLRHITFRTGQGIAEANINRLKSLGIKVILDIDDYWWLPSHHGMHRTYKDKNVMGETEKAISLVDHVITTTETFADIIRRINENVTVIPNCINPDEPQFQSREIKNNRLRFGWIGGVFHSRDISQIATNFCKLYKDKQVKDYQVCLGGFSYDYKANKASPEYMAIENYMTCNYEFKTSDSTYYEYLNSFTPVMEHFSYDKTYRRLWGRDVHTYGELYNEIDVALIPLENTKFNSCKSELKLVEAGWMGKAVIVSDVDPYSEWIEDGVNGIKINPKRNNTDWYLAMKRLIDNPEKVQEMGENLKATIHKYFDMDKHNERRYELYRQLCPKSVLV